MKKEDKILRELNNPSSIYKHPELRHNKITDWVQLVCTCNEVPLSYITSNFTFLHDNQPVNFNAVSFARYSNRFKWVKKTDKVKPRKVNNYEKVLSDHVNIVTRELEIMGIKNMIPTEMLKNITSNLVSLMPNKSDNVNDQPSVGVEDVPRIIADRILHVIANKLQEDTTMKVYTTTFKHMGKKYSMTCKYDTINYYILLKLTGPGFKYSEYGSSKAIEQNVGDNDILLRKIFIKVIKDFLEMEFKHEYN